MKYVIGNWKANKTSEEVRTWTEAFTKNDLSAIRDVQVIICPPFPFLREVGRAFQNYEHISVGCQDLSRVEGGTYTGEVTAASLSGLATYALLGHSERRTHFSETNDIVAQKASQAIEHHINPIVCIRDKHDTVPPGVTMVAYEPPGAISGGTGVGKNISPEEVVTFKQTLALPPNSIFIYGGSSNETNASLYLKRKEIDGLLPGGASLDPQRFFAMITAL